MDYIDEIRQEVSDILAKSELTAGDIRRLGYLEAQMNRALDQDY